MWPAPWRSHRRDEDYAITTAGDGIIALAKALADPPELVISEAGRPDLDFG